MHGLHKLVLFHVLTCLGQNARGSKIIHGEIAPKKSMLYMASLQNDRGQHVCGGFLISEDFVLTAAHCSCLDRVVLGAHNLMSTDNGIIRLIEKKYRHPHFVKETFGNDIMLLKLSERVQLDNSIKTIPLPGSKIDVKENESCRVAGWGAVRSQGPSVNVLRVVDVSVVNLQVCQDEWSDLPDKVICAGAYGTKNGACQGDSGGPLVCNGTAVGIVSFNWLGICKYPHLPNVYTDISKHLPWIRSILNGMEDTE